MAYIQDWGTRVQAQPQINTTRRAFLHLSQNENGRMLNIRITDVNIPSGSTAVLAGTKPDGTVYSQAGTLAGNTATFAEDVQMTAVAGTWDAKITVTNGGNCICTARITITIDPDTVAGGAIPSDSQLDGIIAECRAIADSVRKEAYGSPLVADAVEDMTDQSRVYVYTGSESGMTAGHWYYYNGSAWADGGVYNAVAVDTDTTLTIAGKAADAKEVGDQLADVKEDLTELQNGGYVADAQKIQEKIDAYLDEHPEATTTVQDGSLTLSKFARVENPDNYSGNDSEKLSSAINALTNGGVILLDRVYELTENVIITRNSNVGRVVVRSINKTATINCHAYEFTSEGNTYGLYGGVVFDGIRFIGTGNLIDGKYLIRMFFVNCYLSGFDHLVYSSAIGRRYLQTIYFINCMIRQIKDYIISLPSVSALNWLYDIRLYNNVIEWSYGLIEANSWQGVYINGNAIEGLTGNVPVFADIKISFASSINSNYFEKNAGTIIDFSQATVRNEITLDISNNLFMQNTQTEGAIIILPMLNTGGCLNIQNNYFRLATQTNAYGIKVMDSVTEVLSNCNITGNVASLYDPNSKITNTKSLSKLYADKLFKVDNVIDQSVGVTKRNIIIPVTGVALNGSTLRTSIPFPFLTQNIDYTITINNLNFVNLGNVASATSVYQKTFGGIITTTEGTFTSNTVYSGTININITFA